MSWLPESKDHLPFTWWKGKPIFLSAILALIAGASIVVTALVMAAAPTALGGVIFTFDNVFERYFLWTPFTYALVNAPSIWLVIGCYLLWSFGEAVERHLGRRAFIRLMLALLLVRPLFIIILGLFGIRGPEAAGFMAIEFGVFLAFATLYPRAQITLLIITIEAWVLAAIFVGIGFLSALAQRDMITVLFLAGEVATAWGMVRYEQGNLTLPTIPAFAKRAPPPSARIRKDKAAPQLRTSKRAPSPDVDAILEKISRDGMQSLTPEERAVLDKASADLQRRG